MASRNFAQLHLAIWTDDKFKALHHESQWLFMHLISQGKLDAAGVIVWRPKTVARSARSMTMQSVEAALAELRADRYVVLDEDTDELLIRSFIRNDKKLKNKNLTVAVVNAWASTDSELIRGVISHEVQRLSEEDPDLVGLKECSEVLAGELIDPHRISLD